jgi:hypothetical protein
VPIDQLAKRRLIALPGSGNEVGASVTQVVDTRRAGAVGWKIGVQVTDGQDGGGERRQTGDPLGGRYALLPGFRFVPALRVRGGA